ncbi:MAG: NADH-quinone oxidoreductase subunit C [Nitrospinae bacterium]|nr:NADH-quinone oxidoreductase subunit C [Nitrospinota bacterium]
MADESVQGENSEVDEETSDLNPEEDSKEDVGRDILEFLEGKFPDSTFDAEAFSNFEDELCITIKPDSLEEVALLLRDDEVYKFTMLVDLTATHYPDDDLPLQVLYQLYSFEKNRRVRLKVKLQEEQSIPTISNLWSSANWMEREVFDLFGINFSGHPDLRRILLPDDWGSHPMLKSYPLEGKGERVYEKPQRKEIGE